MKNTYILALLCTAILLISMELQEQKLKSAQAELAEQNTALQKKIEELQRSNQELKQQVDSLEKVIDRQEKPDRGGEREMISLGEYTVTAYCGCEKCCGRWAKNRPGGKVVGAAGIELTAGISVAAPLPLGTEIVINGHRYTVQDRPADWIVEKYDGRIIDIYFDSHEAALAWGRQIAEVYKVERVGDAYVPGK